MKKKTGWLWAISIILIILQLSAWSGASIEGRMVSSPPQSSYSSLPAGVQTAGDIVSFLGKNVFLLAGCLFLFFAIKRSRRNAKITSATIPEAPSSPCPQDTLTPVSVFPTAKTPDVLSPADAGGQDGDPDDAPAPAPAAAPCAPAPASVPAVQAPPTPSAPAAAPAKRSGGAVWIVVILAVIALAVSIPAARDSGYQTGYSAGRADGYDVGHADGYDTGVKNGTNAGASAGYAHGVIDQMLVYGYVTRAAEYAEENGAYEYFLDSLDYYGYDSAKWK